MSKKLYIYTFFFPLLIAGTRSYAQKSIPLLERTVTLTVANLKTDAALNKIAAAGGFSFSYNPAIIDINRSVNYSFEKKTIREIINTLFDGKIEGKVKGNHVILARVKPTPPKEKERSTSFVISGYVIDKAGEKIPWASIYNKESLSSAISNAYGFYLIELPSDLQELKLYVSKKNYNDTTVTLSDNTSDFINITIDKPFIDTVSRVEMEKLYSDAEKTAHSLFMTQEDEANAENISDTLYRKWQVSVIPFVGTNGRLSGNVINDYSFNVFGGYSMGITKAELAGMFNINRGDAGKVQVAGFSNAAGGNVEGLQLAGFTNTIKGSVHGLQMAGFVNVAWKEVRGGQVAGFTNTARGKSHGVQVSGFLNTYIDTSSGAQVSGFCNVALREFKGAQVSGMLNFAAGNVIGNQTGFVNFAARSIVSQVGFFNYADTTAGVPVGFLSFVNKGYHKIEISADEVIHANLAFRSGVQSFHNIITAGIRPSTSEHPLWTFGYGIGSSVQLGKKASLDLDLISNQVVKGSELEHVNLINKLYTGIDWHLSPNFSIVAGPTLNMHIYKTSYEGYPQLFSGIHPNVFYSENFELDDLTIKMWIGGKIAIRFL